MTEEPSPPVIQLQSHNPHHLHHQHSHDHDLSSSNIRYIAPFSRNLTSPYDPVLDPPYLTVWEVEKFSLDYWRVWLGVNWTWSVYISVIYLTVIFLVQLWMKNKPPYALRNVLTGWNFLLAVFSFLGTIRTWPEMVYILGHNSEGFFRGFHLSVCQRYGTNTNLPNFEVN